MNLSLDVDLRLLEMADILSLSQETMGIIQRAYHRQAILKQCSIREYHIMLKMTKLKCTPKAKLIAMELMK